MPELGGTVGDELLKVHVSYGPLVQRLLKRFNPYSARSRAAGAVKALAHITGGGFVDNIPRVLPAQCDVLIRKNSWEVLPVFQLIQRAGDIADAELYQVFNMGIGMVLVVAPAQADAVLAWIRARKQKAWMIGEVVRGKGGVQMV